MILKTYKNELLNKKLIKLCLVLKNSEKMKSVKENVFLMVNWFPHKKNYKRKLINIIKMYKKILHIFKYI